ncbi:MAG: hypothetical protein QME90_09415 [Thermodesulfobacteriota bacterium]|nr:hypothetical protein [Thermodesulfobacteriota bacterium]
MGVILTGVSNHRVVAQTSRLPFDRLRVSGDILKPFEFSVHAEPFLRLRSGHSEKTVCPEVLEG